MSWSEFLDKPHSMINYKDFQLSDIKADGDPGRFTGRASVFGVVDHVNEVVMPGAFTRTLQERGNVVKVLAQHDPFNVIGKAQVEQSESALEVIDGRLSLTLQDAVDMHTRVKEGLVDGISIGYEVREDRFEDGVRKLLDIDLWEISLVTFPANPLARVTGVKSLETRLDHMLKSDSLDPEKLKSILEMAEKLQSERSAIDELVDVLRQKLQPQPPADNDDGEDNPPVTDDEDDEELKAALEELLTTVREDKES